MTSRPKRRSAHALCYFLQPIPVLIHDTTGSLVLHDGQLVAVLARLDGESHDPEFKGRWHLEAGFGRCQEVGTELFENLEEAARWAYHRVRLQTDNCDGAPTPETTS